jgi:hypothetical protein
VPIGGIIAGAVVGAIVVTGIIVFGWYKAKTYRQHNSNMNLYSGDLEENQAKEARTGGYEGNAQPTNTRGVGEVANNSSLKYPDIPSANVQTVY